MNDVTLTVTVPAADAQRIMTAVCASRGYQPASQAEAIDFVKQQVFKWLAEQTIGYESQQAAQAVFTNASDPLANALAQQE
jgi:hypothetical protein